MRSEKNTARQGIDVAELMAWEERCRTYGRDFWAILVYARSHMLRRCSAAERDYIDELVDLLEEAQKPLRPPILGLLRLHPHDPLDRLFNYQKRSIHVGVWGAAALAVYDDDRKALENFAARAVKDREAWPSLSRALIENRLHDWRDWRSAGNPEKWIARVTRHIQRQEAADADAPGTNQSDLLGRRRNTSPLDAFTDSEITEVDAEISLRYNFDGFREEARRRGDLEVMAYIEGLEVCLREGVATPRDAHRQICQQMGWNKFEASKIRARFLRLRSQAVEHTVRRHPAVTDASVTTYFEPLYDGTRGGAHGDWTHKKPPETVKPLKTRRK